MYSIKPTDHCVTYSNFLTFLRSLLSCPQRNTVYSITLPPHELIFRPGSKPSPVYFYLLRCTTCQLLAFCLYIRTRRLLFAINHTPLLFYIIYINVSLISSTEYQFTTAVYILMVCIIWSSHILYQPGKVANPTRGQLNRENEYSPVPVRA